MRPSKATELITFAIVGGVGFLTEAVILEVLIVGQSWGVFAGRAISFPGAVTITWLLNRVISFRTRCSLPAGAEYRRYLAVQILGVVINLVAYALAVSLAPPLRQLPIIPLAIGAWFGLLFNFFAPRHFIFMGHRFIPGSVA